MADTERKTGAPGRISMTQEESESVQLKEFLRRFFDEVETPGNAGRLHDFLSQDCVVDHPLRPTPVAGPAGFSEILKTYHQAFPDIRFEMTDVLTEDGHKAAIRAIVRGTNSGPWLSTPASHRTATWTTTQIFHLKKGKITRLDVDEDLIGMMKQLGIETIEGNC